MEERYLFKAKRVDNGEWVQGFLARYIPNCECANIVNDFDILVPVKADTICQCTGLKDKNGKLMWENDILVGHLDDDFPEDTTYTMVVWHNNGFYTKEQGSEDVLAIDEFDQEHFEVCGNRFDNPELMGVEHDTD